MTLLWIAAFGAAIPALAAGIISTVAGIGTGDGASATSIGFSPTNVAVDAAGKLYFTDGTDVVRQVATNGTVITVAGSALAGFSGDNGPATSAQLNSPSGLAVDTAGNLYIADTGNRRIRKVAADGTITTVAGNGAAGFGGDNGPATSAELDTPVAVAVDATGNLYIADSGNDRIRKVATSGTINTVAGNGTAGFSGDTGAATSAQLYLPFGVAIDTAGNLYIADYGNNRVRKVSADGIISSVAGTGSWGYGGDNGPATAAIISDLYGIAVDAAGNLYLVDSGNHRVRKVAPDGTITTVAGNGIAGFAGDNGSATSAQLDYPYDVAVDNAGNLYIADNSNYRIRRVTTNGTITTMAGNGTKGFGGDGGAATAAQLLMPTATTVDAAGNLYIADSGNYRVRKVATGGTISTVAGNGTFGYSGDNGPATSAQLSSWPTDVAVDAAGNLYIADSDNHRIRKVATDGTITTVAGNGIQGFSGDNGQAALARLNGASGVALDASGNLYIADSGNHRIRKVAPNGTITTVAGNGTAGFSGDNSQATSAQLSNPIATAIDAAGNLYIVDYDNNRIRVVAAGGTITTIAGNGTPGFSGDNGLAPLAQIYSPGGIAVDAAGNLYIADSGNNRIRKIATDGIIATAVGNGTAGFSGDNGPPISAQLNWPTGVALDAAGNLYISDNGNNRIRKVDPSGSGTPGGTVTLNLVTGWNLLGNGIDAALHVATAFADATKVSTVWKWVASTSSWAFYTPTLADGGAAYASSKGYEFLTSVNAGEGFWLNAKASFTAQLPSGSAVSSASFQSMGSGWNLIAVGDNPSASAFNKALSVTPPASGDIPVNLTTLWAWDSQQSNWYFYAPSLEKNGGLSAYVQSKGYLDFAAKPLDPTMGLWVNKP